MSPVGSITIPKPDPRMPPPYTGEDAVLLVPSAGWPFGLRTTKQSVEFGVPCTTLLPIQAYPFLSNMGLAGPAHGHAGLPELLNFTASVQASRFCVGSIELGLWLASR